MLEPLKYWFSSYLAIIRNPFAFLPIIIINIIILNMIFRNKLLKVSIISLINQSFFIIMASEIPRSSLHGIIPFQLNDITHNIIRILLILMISVMLSVITSLSIKEVSKMQFYYLVLICLLNVFMLYILSNKVPIFFC